MTAAALSHFIFTAKYANHVAGESRRETKTEARERKFDMHRGYYLQRGPFATGEWKLAPVSEDARRPLAMLIDEAEEAFADNLALGSQRVLQYGGVGVLRKHARAYNCCFSFADRPRFFQEAFWLLLCGSGTGFSVQWHHVDKLPTVIEPTGEEAVYRAADTIEGWADSLGVLMSSYFDSDDTPFPEYRGKRVVFDLDGIRAEGSDLSSGGGKAPGPEPLRRALEKIRNLLDRCVARNRLNGSARFASDRAYDLHHDGRLQPIDVYDIEMHASDAVLSGGVRRSASICLFSPDDLDMAQAKTGNWGQENPQRGRSNNSALLIRGQTSYEQYAQLVAWAREWGEPGVVWSDSTEMGVNPCVEASFWPVCEITGESGWQFCNLSLANMGAVRDMGDARRAVRAAAIMGTLQAGYTDFEYLGPVSERITRREALLGVSMTGMMEAPELVFDAENLQELAAAVLSTNAEVAALLGINVAARATCIKPEGTSSCLLSTSSGIHAHHARRYLRRVQANRNEAPAQYFESVNSHAVEASVWSESGTDLSLIFAVDAGAKSMVAADVSALKMLELVKLVKENWVDAGRRIDRCTRPWISHNVSNTIVVGDGEWEQVTRFVYEHRQAYAGVSMLAAAGDLDYAQAPFVEVLDPEEMKARYGHHNPRDLLLVTESQPAYRDLWDACDDWLGRTCTPAVMEMQSALRSAWCRQMTAFCEWRFGNSQDDKRRASHCLKSLWIWERWQEITTKTRDVDYRQMNEQKDGTSFSAAPACAGGACQIL